MCIKVRTVPWTLRAFPGIWKVCAINDLLVTSTVTDCAENPETAAAPNTDRNCKDHHSNWRNFEEQYYQLYVDHTVSSLPEKNEFVFHKTMAKVNPGHIIYKKGWVTADTYISAKEDSCDYPGSTVIDGAPQWRGDIGVTGPSCALIGYNGLTQMNQRFVNWAASNKTYRNELKETSQCGDFYFGP